MDNLVKNISIILARGGSKRLPNKNILKLNGKPMLSWTIEAALKSEKFNRVIVSTDDEEIAEIAIKHGVEVPFLRDSAFDDFSPSSEATIIALKQAEKHWNEKYDIVTQLMANCPLRNQEDIKKSTAHFIKNNFESQISCAQFGWMNPWWSFSLNQEGKADFLFEEKKLKRSQDSEKLFFPSGAIWISKTSILKDSGTFYSKNCRFFPLHWISAIDVDDKADFEMAEACFHLKNNLKN
tara:strand:- start:528 stop:1241 length:714 start_codon:yes stop_codon:yes gene_type:complete